MISIKDAVEGVLNTRELSAEEAVDRHFGPTFRQRVNGSWSDRAGFVARVDDLRKIVEHATLTVLEELTDENRYAGRHIVTETTLGLWRWASRGGARAVHHHADSPTRGPRSPPAVQAMPFGRRTQARRGAL